RAGSRVRRSERPMNSKPPDAPPPPPDESPRDPSTVPPTTLGRRRRGMFFVIAAAAILAAGFGIVTRVRARSALRKETEASAAPIVSTLIPAPGAPLQELILAGAAQAYTDSPIYARTSGYLKKWYADIGARVRKGQPL